MTSNLPEAGSGHRNMYGGIKYCVMMHKVAWRGGLIGGTRSSSMKVNITQGAPEAYCVLKQSHNS